MERRSLHILHVMSCRGWSSDAYWAGRVTRELQERGHVVTFVGRADAEAKVLSPLRALGVTDLRGLAFGGRRAPTRSFRDVLTLGRLMRQCDVVHVHRGKEHWMAALANLLVRRPVPLVRTRHIVWPVRLHPGNRWLYRRATAHVVAVTTSIRMRYIMSGLLPPSRVTALPGGVDHRRFHPGASGDAFRRAAGVPDGAPVVGVLAGLRAMKGHQMFLDAVPSVLTKRPETRFLVVGGGAHESAIRDHVRRLGLEHAVTMVGVVPHPEQAVAAFDVAVYPSLLSEGMGRVVFEYMATARPVVASAVGAAAEVLTDGETALLVPPGDSEALARAIETFLADAPLRARAGQRCRELVETRYSGAAVAESLEWVYDTALARHGEGVDR